MSLYSGVIDVGVRIELYKRLRNKEEEVVEANNVDCSIELRPILVGDLRLECYREY